MNVINNRISDIWYKLSFCTCGQ